VQKSLHTEHKLFHGSFYSWHLACNRHSFLTLLHATKEYEKVNIVFWLIHGCEHIKVSLTQPEKQCRPLIREIKLKKHNQERLRKPTRLTTVTEI